MSFAIEVEDVARVLLADGWHRVHGGSFEVTRRLELVLDEEQVHVPEWPAFTFVERRGWRRLRVSGPLSSVLALEERPGGDDVEEVEEGEDDDLPEDELDELDDVDEREEVKG